MSEEFTDVLKSYMMLAEHRTEEEADALIKKYPDIVCNGILSGNFMATAIAIAMKEGERDA